MICNHLNNLIWYDVSNQHCNRGILLICFCNTVKYSYNHANKASVVLVNWIAP